MGFFDLFREKDNKESLVNMLGKIIFDYSETCATGFQTEIEDNIKEKPYSIVFLSVMMSSVFFYSIHTNRIIYKQLGQQGIESMVNDLFLTVMDLFSDKYLHRCTEEQATNFKESMINGINTAQGQYANCKELYYVGDLGKCVATNTPRRGYINQFADVLCEVITGNSPCTNLLFISKVQSLVSNFILEEPKVFELVIKYGHLL